jgi:nucleotide-binding universal stress UspA family protein
MTDNNPNPVVIALSGDPMDSAITFAVAEAERAGCGLHLLHVVPVLGAGPAATLVPESDPARAGRLTLTAGIERVRALVGNDVRVTGEQVFDDGVVRGIVSLVGDARLVVLEHRDLRTIRRVVTRSIVSGVAAHARVPVASVPAGWQAGEPGSARTVTVGVDVPERSEPVLRAAAEAALARGAKLHVIHTWHFPSAYDDIVMTPTEREQWAAKATEEIQALLDQLGDELAAVPVQIEARHGYPGDALIHASPTSELLVLGRHDQLLPVGSHLGPVVRAVLREASCPVLLVDPGASGRWHRHRHQAADTAAQPS